MTPPAPGNSQPQAPCLGEKDSTALTSQRPVAAADSAVCVKLLASKNARSHCASTRSAFDYLVIACTLSRPTESEGVKELDYCSNQGLQRAVVSWQGASAVGFPQERRHSGWTAEQLQGVQQPP